MPSPTGYSAILQDITSGERNSKGTLFIDLVAKKWKLELNWSAITQPDLIKLIDALEANLTFNVTFLSLKGETITRNFYKGDRKASALLYKDGVMVWKDFAVNLIEV